MIIRSQDKKNIVNFNNIKNIKVQGWENIFDICVAEYNFFEKIGTYSTEEKAMKVLDMIQDAYCRMEDVKCHAVTPTKEDSFCFQMPQDSEV